MSGEEKSIPGLLDKNIQEVDAQYRAFEGIVSVGDRKTLERITHEEIPWKSARKGFSDGILSSEPIRQESIEAYFAEKHR
ncbi:MAG: hypothetical protein Q4D52_02695 [Eubacteriales bacterium]|nr:hypothetical protein [Eubacteriales bacterium]